MDNSPKFWVFHVCTVLTGAFAAFAYVHLMVTEFETLTFLIVSFVVNFFFYIALIFGMQFIESYGTYTDTTTYTYDMNTGESKVSTFTAEEKAFWATFFKRCLLIVLCWIAAPVSQIVYCFVVPCTRNDKLKTSHKTIIILVSLAVTAIAATLPLWAL